MGDNLYLEYMAVQSPVGTLLKRADGKMDLGHSINLDAGTKGELRKHSGRNWTVLCFDFITRPGVGGPAHACLVDTNDDRVFDKSMFRNRDKYFELEQPVPYDVSNQVQADMPEGFKRIALYQGVSKGTVKVSFREFVNDLARPAFTQDVSYDLERDGTTLIAFQGLRVRVLRATNAGIEYVVERPFRGSLLDSSEGPNN